MSLTLDFESDQFLTLLTDALRAGPGSPTWHTVVEQLRDAAPATAADLETESGQLQTLIAVRENLESGKGYRSVRAGPGFRRRVMDQINSEPEAEPAKVAGIGGGWIAGVSMLVGLAILGVIGYFLFTGPRVPENGADALASRYFSQTDATAKFNGDLPDGWTQLGQLPLSFNHAMAPMAVNGALPAGGGGICLTAPLPADTAAALEVTLVLGHGDELVPQIFVSDSPDFSPDRGASAHELACFIEHRTPQAALPDGTLAGKAPPIVTPFDPVTVRLVVDQDNAIIQCGGKVVWSGPNQLSPTSPRYFGVRYIHPNPGNRDRSAAVESIRVMQ